MYVDYSSLFVKFEFYKSSFNKYLLEFTSKWFVKKSLKSFFCLMYVSSKNLIYLMCEKKWFSTDMKTKLLSSMKIPARLPLL